MPFNYKIDKNLAIILRLYYFSIQLERDQFLVLTSENLSFQELLPLRK